MRFLTLAALCLLAAPAQASTFTFSLDAPYQSQSWQIQLQADPAEHFNVGLSVDGGPGTLIAPYDPATYSTSELHVLVFGNGHLDQSYFGCSEFDFNCSRQNQTHDDPYFIVGDGIINIYVSEQITGPYSSFGPVSIILSIPDDLNASVVAAVPEPSTWAMMILGFAGIGAMSWCRRRNHGPNCSTPLVPSN